MEDIEGEQKEAWIVDYTDAARSPPKDLRRKKEADAFAATASVEVREGTHVADSASVTVKQAGDLWIASAEKARAGRTTLDQYRQHLTLHIEPFLGRTLLSRLNAPTVRAFEDKLRDEGRSPTLTRYVVRSLGALLADAQERGLAVRNTVRELRGRRKLARTAMPTAREGEAESWRRHSYANGDQSDCRVCHGALAAVPADGDLHRVACIGITGPAVE